MYSVHVEYEINSCVCNVIFVVDEKNVNDAIGKISMIVSAKGGKISKIKVKEIPLVVDGVYLVKEEVFSLDEE